MGYYKKIKKSFQKRILPQVCPRLTALLTASGCPRLLHFVTLNKPHSYHEVGIRMLKICGDSIYRTLYMFTYE